MCGIAGTVGAVSTTAVRQMLDAQQHRGPDGRSIWRAPDEPFILGHDRLAIIDVAGGEQPIPNEDETLWIAVNGEIYNHEALAKQLRGRHEFRTGSDSEVLLHLYEEMGPDAVAELDGMFAAAIWGPDEGLFLARDPLGIKPLYYGRDADETLYFGSEIKSLVDQVPAVKEFRNGHYWTEATGRVEYYALPVPRTQVSEERPAIDLLEETLVEAVQKRLMADVPLGVFLSGGLDSSLIAAITRKHCTGDLVSFCIGLEGSADVESAREVAAYLGTEHHEYIITRDEIIRALPTVITHLESYDPALVRSSIPTYFVSRLAAGHVKVVLSGEGADELFAGYHYLDRFAEDTSALSRELHLITSRLHNTNLQRVDRMTMAHGLEGRVPFLDTDMVDLAFRMDPELKRRDPGKWVLRKVAEKYLPGSIVWREKEKFAIGTGVGPTLELYAEEEVSDERMERGRGLDGQPFGSKEALLYWSIFAEDYARPDIVNAMGHSRSVNPGERWEEV